MADATIDGPTSEPRKRRSWPRVLGWIAGILFVLAITFYFVLSSSRFFQVRVLPRVSEAIHANVTVSSAEIHPFSQIILRDLKIQPTNQPPILTAHEVRLKYSLLDILGGDIRVEDASVVSPVLQIVQSADGASNLDPLFGSQKKTAGQKTSSTNAATRVPKIDIRKLTVSNASVLYFQNHVVGTRDLVELTNMDATITGVRNGDAGKIQFAAIIRDENNPPAPAMYGLLQAKIDGVFNFGLSPELTPESVIGDAHLNISQAAGSFSDFAKLDGALHCDLSSAEIKAVTLNFQKAGVPLGEVRARGPYNAQKSEGRLNVELLAVDKQVLNLFGAKAGIDFGSTTITLTNEIDLSKSGAAISVAGHLRANEFQVSITNQSTPPIDLHADYNVSVDKVEKTALLRTLNVTGTQHNRPLLRAELTSPMTLAWGKTTNVVGDSSINFTVTRLNIADWKTFVGDFASGGTVDLNAKVLSEKSGRHVTFDATNQIQNLEATIGDQRLSDATLTLKTHGEATNLKQFNLDSYDLQLTRSNVTAMAISGSGTYNRTNRAADLHLTLRTTIPRMLRLLGETNMVYSGFAELKAHVTQRRENQTLDGNLVVTNFTGKLAEHQFTNFGVNAALVLSKTPEQIDILDANGALTQGRNPGGNFDLTGTYSLTNKPSRLAITLSGVNENGLRPFLDPFLADRKLVSIAVAGTASASREPNGDSTIKADLQITNLVVSEPTQATVSDPLDAKVKLDVSVARQIAEIRQLEIGLTPTQRAKNQFQLQGKVDMAKTNAIQGNLTLAADSLDLTSYYDLFTTTNKTKPAAPTVVANNSQSVAVPTALPGSATTMNQLPFRNFTIDANVGEFYLREIAATNFHAGIKLDSSHVRVAPLQLTLNGSPIRAAADVDLSVPGGKYALTFNATNVPFAPLWNSFNPDEKGEMAGELTAQIDMSGVGTTGESLQKSLSGKFDIATTNLNLPVNKIRSPVLKQLIIVVARLPDILTNSAKAGTAIAGGAVENALGSKLSGGLSGDLNQSPIDVITARGTVDSDKVELQQATVRSTVFQADATGTITLAKEFTNSAIQIPITISLARPVADRIGFLPDNTPTNAAYVKFPDFYSESGTIGKPIPHIDPLPLGAEELQKLGFKIPGLGGTNGVAGTNDVIGGLLQGVDGLFQGYSNTNQADTNQPAPASDLLNRLLAPGGK